MNCSCCQNLYKYSRPHRQRTGCRVCFGVRGPKTHRHESVGGHRAGRRAWPGPEAHGVGGWTVATWRHAAGYVPMPRDGRGPLTMGPRGASVRPPFGDGKAARLSRGGAVQGGGELSCSRWRRTSRRRWVDCRAGSKKRTGPGAASELRGEGGWTGPVVARKSLRAAPWTRRPRVPQPREEGGRGGALGWGPPPPAGAPAPPRPPGPVGVPA